MPEQPYRYHGNTYAALLLTLFVGGCAVAISFVPFLIEQSFKHDHLEHQSTSISDVIQCIYSSFLSVLCLWFVWKYAHYVNNGRVELPQQRLWGSAQGSHSSTFQIILFGIGGILYLLCDLVKILSEHPVHLIQVASRVLLLVCLISFIIFLRLYRGALFRNCRIFQYSIALMIGTVAWAWIFITVSPLWTLSIGNFTDQISSSSNHSSNSFQMDFDTIIEMIEGVLEPFFVEFLSISAGCLLSILFTMRSGASSNIQHNQNGNRRTEDLEQNQEIQDYGNLLREIDEESLINGRVIAESETSKCHQYVTMSLSVFVGIGCFILMQFITVGPLSNISSSFLPKEFYPVVVKCVVLVTFVPQFVMCLLSLKKIQHNNVHISKIKQLTASDNLLLFTTAVHFSYYCLRFIAAVGVLIVKPKASKLLLIYYMLFTVYSVAGKWTQTQVIIAAHYIYRSGHKPPKLVEHTLIYIFVLSIAMWLDLSTEHGWIEHETDFFDYAPEFATTYGNFNTKVILLAFDPIIILSYFHAAVATYGCLWGQ